jgi:hypothetical protein
MDCTRREQLLAQWKDAAAQYAELSASMVNCGVSPSDALTQLGEVADALRLELEQHIRMHGCSGGGTKAIVFRTT